MTALELAKFIDEDADIGADEYFKAADMLRRQHSDLLIAREAIKVLREALTNSLCTLQQVHGYALMSQADVKRVEQSLEYAERELQLTDDLK